MREIKFRAWDKQNKVMVEVDGINFNEFGFQQFKCAGIACNLPETELSQILRISEVELIQYTGLKDKNGVEIYEGDVVKIYRTNIIGDLLAKVTFNDGCFDVVSISHSINGRDYLKCYVANHSCEIIGNIHQNQELLKVDI